MEQNKREFLVTFDYELFLGPRSGSVANCLIGPTERLLRILSKHSIRAIFFVDTVYLLRLREVAAVHMAAKNDYDLIIAQLEELTSQGHYIYPHLHPHWLDAEYSADLNSWDLSNASRFRIESLVAEDLERLFNESLGLLNQIVHLSGRHQAMEGYRAGGYSIQPFGLIKPLFEKNGVYYEFSVLPGKHYTSAAQKYDFRTAPNRIYRFKDDVCLESPRGPFTEFPISTVRLPKAVRILNAKLQSLFFVLQWKYAKSIGDGTNVQSSEPVQSADSPEERRALLCSFEMLNPVTLVVFLFAFKKRRYLHFISHPKMLSGLNLLCLSWLLRIISATYRLETDFKRFSFDRVGPSQTIGEQRLDYSDVTV